MIFYEEIGDRKALEMYVMLRGYKNGGNRQAQCQNGTLLSLDEIAKELGASKRDLQRALSIERNLTEDMKELLDSGEITKTFARVRPQMGERRLFSYRHKYFMD